MKSISLTILITLILLISFSPIKKYINLNVLKPSINERKTELKDKALLLKECFDLENKNKRTLRKSIEIIEFCIEKYGYNK